MAKLFGKCPNPDCGNKSPGDYIYQCKKCRKIVCSVCSGYTCPGCGATGGTFSEYYREIGEIKR